MFWLNKRRSLRRDLDDEFQSHVEMRAESLIAKGWPRAAAYEEARKMFGNLTLTTERTREVHISTRMETIWKDTQYALRRLCRQPVFSLTAILTLGLVIGANGAIFSVLEAVLLRSLPYPKPSQLVALMGTGHLGQMRGISLP